jgi:hypothetical protein
VVNGQNVDFDPDGGFVTQIQLGEGANEIDVTATDLAGNSETVTINVSLVVIAPSTGPILLHTSDFDEIQLRLNQRGLG